MKKNILLAILSGVLFSIAWPTYGFPLFLFFAFVPLLLIEEDFIKTKLKKAFFCIFI
jgi:apolipoprotein N-acyltransferase